MGSGLRVRDVMSKEFRTIGEEEFLSRAVGMFREGAVKPGGALLVVDGRGRCRGVLTERMIVRSRLDPSRTKVKAVYRSSPLLSPEDPVEEAARLMVENDLKHLPVCESGRLVGVVRDMDLLRSMVEGEEGKRQVGELATREVRTIDENEPLSSALALMREEGVSRLPVTRRGRPVGIITMHDLVVHVVRPKDQLRFGDLAGEKPRPLSNPVRSIMSEPLVSLPPTATLREAVELMESRDVASVVLLEDGRLEGILTKADLLSALAKGREEEGVYLQLSLSREEVEDLEYERMLSDLKAFARKYSPYVKGGTLTAHFKRLRGEGKNRPLVSCRLVLRGKFQLVGVGEGWGFSQALSSALEHAERRLMRSKEIRKDRRVEERFLEKSLWE
jgi:CBS domain-containing protein